MTALVAGGIAATSTLVAMEFDLWGEALPVQLAASLSALIAAALGWRTGLQVIIVAGLAIAALSWAPLGLIVYSCAILSNCP